MTTINPDSPVLVTGASGYVAGWLIKTLLEQGRRVHAAVRDPGNESRLAKLKAMAAAQPDRLKFFKADLLDEGSYREAMDGCELVYHTASPFTTTADDPQRDLVDPAVNGTANVLNSAKQTPSVKRVVVTSSCASIYSDSTDMQKTKNGVFTEEDWNTESSLEHQPYYYSKTLAEKKAWEIAESQDRWDLVVINPSFVVGPGIDPQATSESFNVITQFGDGTLKSGAPDYGMGVVDVRDVGMAHFKAGNTPAANGRYIISGHNSSFTEIAKVLHEEFGKDYPIPTRTAPKWLLWLIGPIVTKGQLTRKQVSRNIGLPWRADNAKSVNDLGMQYRPMKESLVEMFQQMIEAGRV